MRFITAVTPPDKAKLELIWQYDVQVHTRMLTFEIYSIAAEQRRRFDWNLLFMSIGFYNDTFSYTDPRNCWHGCFNFHQLKGSLLSGLNLSGPFDKNPALPVWRLKNENAGNVARLVLVWRLIGPAGNLDIIGGNDFPWKKNRLFIPKLFFVRVIKRTRKQFEKMEDFE